MSRTWGSQRRVLPRRDREFRLRAPRAVPMALSAKFLLLHICRARGTWRGCSPRLRVGHFGAPVGTRFPWLGTRWLGATAGSCIHRTAECVWQRRSPTTLRLLAAMALCQGVPRCPKGWQKPGVPRGALVTPWVLSSAGGELSWLGLWGFFGQHCNMCFTL